MKDRFEERRYDRVKEKILKVLELIRVELCEVMYIYYYRRLVYADELNLECLWKIYQLDEEWAVVKELKRDLSENTIQFLKSLDMEIHPSVNRLLEEANDIRTLKLLQEYVEFELFRKKSDMKKRKMDTEEEGAVVEGATFRKKDKKRLPPRANLVAEVEKQHDLVRAIKKDKFFITPAELFENIELKVQKYRPYTPNVNPIKEF